jgi:prepilin-type N-terminal cleavage/methylation domain-containing protein
MKKVSYVPCQRSRAGFTLVELLVVIGIIAILAGVLLTAGGSAIKAALRAKASNTATQIQTACLNYYTEYSVYPVPTGTTTDYPIVDTDATDWGILVDALCGNISPTTGTAVAATTITNTRSIAFLSLKASDVGVHDAPLNPLPPDPKNQIYFNIALDGDYDGVLGVAPSAVTTMPNFSTGTATSLTLTGGSSTAGVAVWANCTGKPNSTTCNAAWWIHTY